ncbi:hypothetical protein JW960_14240 [candidate division KSB1 bacterium]|nr:hypothetical protein [candidate division KSB1 bacterium]
MMDIPGVNFDSAWKNITQSFYDTIPIYIIGLDDLIKAKETISREPDLLDLKHLKVVKQKGQAE